MSVATENISSGHQETNQILFFDDPDLWNQVRFRQKLLESLEREKFDQRSITLVAELFERNETRDFPAFKRAVEQMIKTGILSQDDRDRLTAVADHWSYVRENNSSVYRPKSVEDHRVRYWPNNPKNLQTNWEYYCDIYEMDLFFEPSRFITKDTAIGSAGSCFAANISRQLQHWDYNYVLEMGLSKEHYSNPMLYETDPAQCGNIYNAVSMRQMIERAFGEWEPEQFLISKSPKFMDPFRSTKTFDSVESYQKSWKEHNAALARAMRKCEVFILTLGMTEAWEFADSGLVTSASPTHGDPTLLRHKNLTVEDNFRELERIYKLFQKYNPGIKIITTVSPVPLNSTFNRDQHVVVANGISKSILRVALEQFSQAHPQDVFYFPSFEIVTTGTRNPWEIDMRHVSNEAVERVMKQFQRQFMVSQEPLETIKVATLVDYTSMRRNPLLRYARAWFVHPLKRVLGIEGKPFGALLQKKSS